MNTLKNKLAMTLTAAVIALVMTAGTAGATSTGNLNSLCFVGTPVAQFQHHTGAGYWGHTNLGCKIQFKADMLIKKNGVTVATIHLLAYRPDGTLTSTIPANVNLAWNSASYTPTRGAQYQVVVSVTTTSGASLGWMTSGTPQVLVA